MSVKGPTLKRILKEASELASQPSADYHAAPLESDLYEWHFTLRGPPAPSSFANGLYHGRIVLPPAYPLKPPSFRFLTPTGRFEVNREICLSISGHHEETWQPAWGIRTALVAIRSFMDTAAGGQVGGMETSTGVRVRMAGQSPAWRCAACAKTNEEIMAGHDEVVQELGEGGKVEQVPAELRLAYREDLGHKEESRPAVSPGEVPTQSVAEAVRSPDLVVGATSAAPARQSAVQPAARALEARPMRGVQHRGGVNAGVPAWIDKAIFVVVAALMILISKKWAAATG